MSKKIKVLKNSLDWQQQHSWRSCILTHGISEQQCENTDKQTFKIIREELGETVEKCDLDRAHRIGTFKEIITSAGQL